MITACIIASKDQAKETIDSLKQTGWQILTGEPDYNDHSAAKNKLLSHVRTEWALFIDPWEILVDFRPIRLSGHSYRVQIITKDIMTKETRLIKVSSGLKFENPVFETINTSSFLAPITLIAKENNLNEKLVLDWKKAKPCSPEVSYYESCVLLSKGDFVNYLEVANHYLFISKDKIPVTMTRYYMGLVNLYINGDIQEALKQAISCLAINPLMAEFWCLVGDIYYKGGDYRKAICFYENAMILGSRRKEDDEWSLEIPKYSSHPQKMINSCLRLQGSGS